MNELISVIIPTRDRVSFIGETLESIINQSYSEWECIVVDDNSQDYTSELIQFYHARESRIKYFKLPKEKDVGANAARNYGFDMSTGDFVTWFDSDDIMCRNSMKLKIEALLNNKYLDFVVGETKNFGYDVVEPIEYNKPQYGIKTEDYITQKINWITSDILVKRERVGKVRFNTELRAGQEFNFFSKLLVKKLRGDWINQTTTLRRVHPNSISGKLSVNSDEWKELVTEIKYTTYLETRNELSNDVKKNLLNWCIRYTLELASVGKLSRYSWRLLYSMLSEKYFTNSYHLALGYFMFIITGRGYYFAKRAKIE